MTRMQTITLIMMLMAFKPVFAFAWVSCQAQKESLDYKIKVKKETKNEDLYLRLDKEIESLSKKLRVNCPELFRKPSDCRNAELQVLIAKLEDRKIEIDNSLNSLSENIENRYYALDSAQFLSTAANILELLDGVFLAALAGHTSLPARGGLIPLFGVSALISVGKNWDYSGIMDAGKLELHGLVTSSVQLASNLKLQNEEHDFINSFFNDLFKKRSKDDSKPVGEEAAAIMKLINGNDVLEELSLDLEVSRAHASLFARERQMIFKSLDYNYQKCRNYPGQAARITNPPAVQEQPPVI